MSDKRQRTAEIRARVTQEERSTIEQAATDIGQSLPDYVRSAVLGQRRSGAQSQRRPKILAQALGKLVEIHVTVSQLDEAVWHGGNAGSLNDVVQKLEEVRKAILDAYRAGKPPE